MADAIYRKPSNEETLTAPSGGYTSGEIVVCPSGRAGVIQGLQTIAEGELATASTTGQYECTAGSAITFSAGDKVDWDATNNTVVDDGDGDFGLGVVAVAKTSGQLLVLVNLNAYVQVQAT